MTKKGAGMTKKWYFSSVPLMALNTQLLFSIKSQSETIRASHQVMTSTASNLPLGPRINSAFSNRMGERGMSFVAINARGNFISPAQ